MFRPLILTLKIDAESQGFFDELRGKYFPPERNFLQAHVTLFHHLPGENLAAVKAALQDIAEAEKSFPLRFAKWRFLGKGSAMTIESAPLSRLRERLAQFWQKDLTAQDRQKFQPHITVQNKNKPDEARFLFETLSADWQARTGFGEGLTLWHYAAPNWELEREFLFQPKD